MPLWIPPNALGLRQTNLTAADRDGTTITSGGSAHTKGAYSAGQLFATTDEDTYGLSVRVSGVHTSGVVTSYLLDIGIGPSGSEVDLIQNIDCWGSPAIAGGFVGTTYYFPVFIPKGERVAARSQALAVSDVCNVGIWLHQSCNGWGMEVPTKWEQLGTITNSNGVSVTPGSGAFGSWTTILDPITKHYKWWHVGFDGLADTTITAQEFLVEVGIGPDTSNVSTIGSWSFCAAITESIEGPSPSSPVFQPLPDDDLNGVFVRIAAGATEARGAVVYAAE